MPEQITAAQELRQVVVFLLDGEEYAVPIEDIQEVVNTQETTPVPNSPDYVAGIINLRGKVVSVVDLEKRFGLVRDNTEKKRRHIIVVDDPSSLYGVLVDEVIEVLRFSKDLIQPAPETVKGKIGKEYVAGVAVVSSHQEATEDDDASVVSREKASDTAPDQAERVLLILHLKNILNSTDKKTAEKPEADM